MSRKFSEDHKKALRHAIQRDIRTHSDMQHHWGKVLRFDRVSQEKETERVLREALEILEEKFNA